MLMYLCVYLFTNFIIIWVKIIIKHDVQVFISRYCSIKLLKNILISRCNILSLDTYLNNIVFVIYIQYYINNIEIFKVLINK